jgi:hypothetical protein
MQTVLASIEAAVHHEFGCYYLADELPAVMDDSWLQAVTRSSAGRMSAHVGAANLDTLVLQLRAAAEDPTHPLVVMIVRRESMLYWLDDDCWPELQRLLGWLARSVDELR